MIIEHGWTNGLVFGLETETIYEMGDDNELTGEEATAINVHLGFFRLIIFL